MEEFQVVIFSRSDFDYQDTSIGGRNMGNSSLLGSIAKKEVGQVTYD